MISFPAVFSNLLRAKITLTLQNSKPPKDNLSKDERKALKELQSDTSVVYLPADKGRSTIILNRRDYLEKCIDHINNGPYQLLNKDTTTKIKAKTLKQSKVIMDNEFIDNKISYLSVLRMKITTPRILSRFPTRSEMFPLKMMR